MIDKYLGGEQIQPVVYETDSDAADEAITEFIKIKCPEYKFTNINSCFSIADNSGYLDGETLKVTVYPIAPEIVLDKDTPTLESFIKCNMSYEELLNWMCAENYIAAGRYRIEIFD